MESKKQIEVEVGFVLDENSVERLVEGARFLGEKKIVDVYFDTADYSLTTKDIWLRTRNGNFELKLPLNNSPSRAIEQYKELETDDEIRKALAVPVNGTLLRDLESGSYRPFCVCNTTRRKYERDGFHIDLDIADFDGFKYRIGEIELMVADQSETEAATRKILDFARQYDLKVNSLGKVIAYLRRMKPDHYRALVKAGVV